MLVFTRIVNASMKVLRLQEKFSSMIRKLFNCFNSEISCEMHWYGLYIHVTQYLYSSPRSVLFTSSISNYFTKNRFRASTSVCNYQSLLLIVKDCFMDLDSFPENEQITATVLINMSVRLNQSCYRQNAGKLEGNCNELDLIAERKPLFMEIHQNEFEFPTLRIRQIAQPINLRILSLSTDEAISSNRYDLKALKVEELVLNIRSKRYSLPEFIKEMGQLKVLSITSYDDYTSKLDNLSSIACLSDLKRIRFEHVSVSSIQPVFALKNLKELSFVMCEIGDALMSYTTESPYMLPNLTTLEIDMCYDLKELPSELCNLVRLENLSVTNCHELDVLPKGLGGLSNLEILRLHCCTKLQELPPSIGSLRNLSSIDISACLSISVLPEEIGELCGLRVLNMNGCGGLQELPISISKLWQLEEVICDEETSYLWMDFETDLHNMKINVVEDDRLESFMKIVH